MTPSDLAIVVRALARCHQRLMDLSFDLRKDPRVSKSNTGIDMRDVDPQASAREEMLYVNLWADAELHDGTGRTWWIELSWEGGRWLVEHSLKIDSADGQENAFTPHVRAVENVEEMIVAVGMATETLTAMPIPPYVPRTHVAGR